MKLFTTISLKRFFRLWSSVFRLSLCTIGLCSGFCDRLHVDQVFLIYFITTYDVSFGVTVHDTSW
jgi:hypothetical protein